MNSGLAQHPWRAYFIFAFAFLATQLATLVASPLVKEIDHYLWTSHRIDLFGGYPVWNLSEEKGVLYFALKYLCIYVFPFLIVISILATRMPTWMSFVVGFLFSTLFGLYTLFTENKWYGYRHALEAYFGSQISCALGSLACFLYRGTVSVRPPNHEDED